MVNFGKNHKLTWGQDKCQIMRVGRHSDTNPQKWLVGDMELSETTTYKYLGDVITNDGKKFPSLVRENLAEAGTRNINNFHGTPCNSIP